MSAAPTLFPLQQVYRFTVDKYHKMIDDGVLGEDDPVELIEGFIVFKMPENDDHILSVRRCRRLIENLLPGNCFYDAEQPVVLPDSESEPEPDGIVVFGSADDARLAKPAADCLALVIEVAGSSLDRDRNAKLRGYARAAIPVYWIVNLIDRQIEVHTDPDPAAMPDPVYRSREIFTGDASVPVRVGDQTFASLKAADILPPI